MMDRTPLKVAILGGGDITRKAYLPLLKGWPGVRIAGLFSRTQQTVESLCSDWQIDFGTTALDALLERRPDAAFVVAPTPAHRELAERLLQSGVDVFVEKPATQYSAETRRLADLAAEKGRIFMVGFNRRYALFYQQAKEIIGERRIYYCLLEKHRGSPHLPGLYDHYVEDTIHQIDLLRFFCGEARPAYTSFEMQGGNLAGALSVCDLEQGGQALVLTNLRGSGWRESLTLHADGLSVEVIAFRELRIRYPDREVVFGGDRPGRWTPDLAERGFQGEIQHFLECVRERKTPQTDGYEAARTQELAETMVACAGVELKIASPAGPVQS